MKAQEVLKKLKEGNKRFLEDNRIYPNQSKEHIKHLAEHGQNPFAVIVCCSDSRVNPIIFFDRGLGDFFIVRSAGNVLDDHAIESIKYAVDNLSTPLILVLGHTKCGAVISAVENHYKKDNNGAIMTTIKPAVNKAHEQDGCLIENTTRNNTANMVELLKQVDFKHKVHIASGLYDIETGVVKLSE